MRRATAALLQRLPHPADTDEAGPISGSIAEPLAGTLAPAFNRLHRRRQRRHARQMGSQPRLVGSDGTPSLRIASFEKEADSDLALQTVAAPARDTAVESATVTLERRAREAGGPIDNASYSCECGLVFAAAVSTTVSCPHCGADQAW